MADVTKAPVFSLPDATKKFDAFSEDVKNFWRILKGTKEKHTLKFPTEEIPKGVKEAVAECRSLDVAVKELQALLEKKKDRIKNFMFQNRAAEFELDGLKVTLTTLSSEVSDEETLKKIYPGAFANVPSGFRLDVKPKKD